MAVAWQLVFIFLSLIIIVIFGLKKKNGWREILLATLMTTLWVSLSGIYSYKGVNYMFYGVNLFPFLSWIGGLLLLKLAYDQIKRYKLLKSSLIYLIILLAAEYLGYNFLGIQLNSGFPGLFGLELLHAPLFAQVYYLIAGPLYLILADFFVSE